MSKLEGMSNVNSSRVTKVIISSVLVLLIFVSLVPLFSLPSVAVAVTLKVTPTRGSDGTKVSGSGSGYSAGSKVTITLVPTSGKSTTVATTTASSTGTISFSFTVPAVTPGAYTVESSGGTGYSAHAKFTVVDKAKIKISPKTGTAGTSVTISGSAFANSSAITIDFDNVKLTTSTSSSTGTVSVMITVPSDTCSATAGDACPITVTDAVGNSASAVFTIS